MASKKFTLFVCNCGSSSLSCQLYNGEITGEGEGKKTQLNRILQCKGHRVGTKSTEPSFIEYTLYGWKTPDGRTTFKDESMPVIESHAVAVKAMLKQFTELGIKIDVVGHRFVHGGSLFHENTIITPEVHEKLVKCLPLAPIHNPNSLSVIDYCEQFAKEQNHPIMQYIVFDTAFHKLSPETYTYAISHKVAEEYGYRKFGFHGLSYQYVMETLERHGYAGKGEGRPRRIVACHLGTGGSSAAGIRDGRTVDTTMGWGTLPGLVMSTRCGDIDPSVLIDLVDKGWTAAQLSKMLSGQSGLVGLTDGITSDLRDVYKIAHTEGHKSREMCALAYEVYVHRLVGAIGSLMAVMGGIDALVFTDDLGFNMPVLRKSVCERLSWLGVKLNDEANMSTTKNAGLLAKSDTALLSAEDSKVKVLTVVNDEEIIIAREVFRFVEA